MIDSEFNITIKEELLSGDVNDVSPIFKKYEDFIKETCGGDWTYTWEIDSTFWDQKIFLKIYFAFVNEHDFLMFKLRWE